MQLLSYRSALPHKRALPSTQTLHSIPFPSLIGPFPVAVAEPVPDGFAVVLIFVALPVPDGFTLDWLCPVPVGVGFDEIPVPIVLLVVLDV